MTAKLDAAFLDFATFGPGVDTSRLEALVNMTFYGYCAPEETAHRIADCDVVVVNKAKLGGDTIRASERLRLVVVAATGVDNVDTEAAKERGVAVANVRDYGTESVAQHAFALILALTRQIVGYDRLVREGAWQRSRGFALFDFPIRELGGLTLGIVGYGALGRAVARLGECFGMEVIVAARPGCESPPMGRVRFDALLDRADVLSLHCPLTAQTRHLIGARELERMKPGALLINTARGALVDGEALAAALRANAIGGAGIDVLPVEPPGRHPLLEPGIPNLIVTPHVAWAAREARQRSLEQVADDIEDFLAGGTLRRVV